MPRFINWLNFLALKVILFIILEYYNMARYISSVVITLAPKRDYSPEPLVSKVLSLDCVFGSTIPHVTHFVVKSPLIKPYLSKYDIVGLTFKYSEL